MLLPTKSSLQVIAFAVASHANWVDSQQPQSPAPSKSEPLPATVSWPGEDGDTPAVCVAESGWFICLIPSGRNKQERKTAQLRTGDRVIEARILHHDPRSQLCLIESVSDIGKKTVPFTISPKTGTTAGHPLQAVHTSKPARLRVAGRDHHYFGQPLPTPMLRIRLDDKSVCRPGTPLINDEGEIEALLAAHSLENEKEAHAIPAAYLNKIISDFRAHQRTGPVWIGAVIPGGATTMEIVKIRENSPASRAGLQKGDVVLSAHNQEVKTLIELEALLQTLPAGKPITITVLRGLEEKDISVTPEFADTESIPVAR